MSASADRGFDGSVPAKAQGIMQVRASIDIAPGRPVATDVVEGIPEPAVSGGLEEARAVAGSKEAPLGAGEDVRATRRVLQVISDLLHDETGEANGPAAAHGF